MLDTLLFLALSASSAAAPLSLADARARADADEESLSQSEMAALVEAQSKVIGTGLDACMRLVGPPPEEFSIVLKLDGFGRATNTWASDHTFARCFRDRFKAEFHYAPPRAGFYTFVEIKLSPEAPPQPVI